MRTTVKTWICASLLLCASLPAAGPADAAALYFPHVDASLPWQTEIAVINTGDQTVTGALRAFSDAGELLEAKSITLPARGRRRVAVADEFTNAVNIGYMVFDTDSAATQGYAKFYQAGIYRTAIPAAKEVNTGNIHVSHIDSSNQWWTGISLVNTTAATKELTIAFNNGLSVPYTLNANEHRAFIIRSLFNGQPQPDIQSAVIANANGVVGLELFGSMAGGSRMDGFLLSGNSSSTIYYPHVDNAGWWTGIVAYNPSAASACTITIMPYSAQGAVLTPLSLSLPGNGKYVGVVSDLGLPAETAWFRIGSTSPVTGFELFGTADGSRLAAYAGGGGTGAREGIFPKIEKDGWTGIAFVNTEDTAASVTLTAYGDDGTAVAAQTLSVGAYAKVVNLAEAIFPQDIGNATYISYTSDRTVIGFQLNGSADGTMLDGLPGLAGGASGTITAGDYTVAAGETVSVSGNLVINATGLVRIDGTLRAPGDLGQSITINAGQGVTIAGSVHAGKGAAGGGAGGSVTITATNGNILLGPGASLRGGDGADGRTTSNPAGGAGGSMTLNAPNGSITIPATQNAIVLGNGGNGADIDTTATADAAVRMQRDDGGFGNRGGDSGRPAFNAQTLIGIAYEMVTLTEDFPPENPIHRVGDVIMVISTTAPFSGGAGGNGGSVILRPSSNPALDHGRALLEPAEGATARGGDGGSGWVSGGQGGSALHLAARGIEGGQTEFERSGKHAFATGGEGGKCWSSFIEPAAKDCVPGKGGDAYAWGGKGAKGPDPNGAGAWGGQASAMGGNGGPMLLTATGKYAVAGTGGDAWAYNGSGGDGGNGCGPLYAAVGGDGGPSVGAAMATGGRGDRLGLAVADGGNGGNGGNGQVSGGSGGSKGTAEVHSGREGSSATDGNDGSTGTTCALAPRRPAIDQIPGTYTLTGTKKIDTCGGWPDTIYNPAVPFTVDGDRVTIHSSEEIQGLFDQTTGSYSGSGGSFHTIETFVGRVGFSDTVIVLQGSLTFEKLSASCGVRYENATYTKNPE